MSFNHKFRTLLLVTTICSQILIPQPSFAGGGLKVKAHNEFMDLIKKRTLIKNGTLKPVEKSTDEALAGIKKGLKAKIKSIEKAFKIGQSEDYQENTNRINYVNAIRSLSQNDDLNSALAWALPLAEEGFIPAMFLAASCHEQLDRPREAMGWFAIAATKGDEDAYKELLGRSSHLRVEDANSLHATFKLAELYAQKGQNNEAISCFDRLIKSEQKEYPHHLLEGMNFALKGKYAAAWGQFRKGSADNNSLYQPHLDSLLQNPRAYLDIVKGIKLTEEEVKAGEDALFACCKRDKRLESEFLNLASEHPVIAYTYACYLLNSLPPEVTSQTKKKGNGAAVSSRATKLQSAFTHLVTAARQGIRGATQRLEQLRDQEKSLNADVLIMQEEFELADFYRTHFDSPQASVSTVKKQSLPSENGRKKKVTRADLPKKKDWNDWLSEAQAFEKAGEIEKAKEAYACARESNHPNALYCEGRFYYKLYKRGEIKQRGYRDKAERFLKKASGGGHNIATYTLGKLFYACEEYGRAKTCWETLHKEGYFQAAYRLGILCLTIEKNEQEGLAYLCYATSCGLGAASYQIALHFEKTGNVKDACANYYAGARSLGYKKSLDKLVERANKECPHGLLNLGVYHFYENNFTEARVLWEKLLVIEHYDHDLGRLLFFNLGRLELAEGHVDEAEKWFLKPTAMKYGETSLALGRLYSRKEQYSKARECLEEALKLMPENGEALYLLGELDIREGKFDEGILKLVKANSYGNPEVEPFLKQLYESGPNPAIAVNLGAVLFQNAKYDEARRYLEIAYKEGDNIVKEVARFNLVEVFINLLDYENALKYSRMCINEKEMEFKSILFNKIEHIRRDKSKISQNDLKQAEIAKRILKELGIEFSSNLTKDSYGSSQYESFVLGEGVVPKKSSLQETADLGSTSAQVALMLVSLKGGKIPLAAEQWKMACEMDSNATVILEQQTRDEQDPVVFVNIGACLLVSKYYQEACVYTLKAIGKAVNEKAYHLKDCYFNLCRAYLGAGDVVNGVKYGELSIQHGDTSFIDLLERIITQGGGTLSEAALKIREGLASPQNTSPQTKKGVLGSDSQKKE